MDKTKLRQVIADAKWRYGSRDTWTKLLGRYLAQGYKCEDCRALDMGPVVHDNIWHKIVYQDWTRVLCQKCMEWRLNRPIRASDCKAVPWNVLRGNIKLEEPMANRVLQAKRLKMKKAKRVFPKRLSAEAMTTTRYNNTSPFAMKNRGFLPPDAGVIERDNQHGLVNGIITDDKPKVFNNAKLAEVHLGLDRNKPLETNLYQDWQSWKQQGCTIFNRIVIVDRPRRHLALYFANKTWIFIEENRSLCVIRRSLAYTSKERALMDFNNGNKIRWAETLPLGNSS